MSFSTHFFFTYSLHSFLKTIFFVSNWDIENPERFKTEMEKNLNAAIEELQLLPSRSISNQELLTKLRRVSNDLDNGRKRLEDESTNPFADILYKASDQFKEHLSQMISEAYQLPVTLFTYNEENTPNKTSSFKHPIRFFETIFNPGSIDNLRNDFFQHWEFKDFDCDLNKEICVFDDFVVSFYREFEDRVNDEKDQSLRLISSSVMQESNQSENYLKAIYKTIQTLLPFAKRIPYRKYSFLEGALKTIKSTLEVYYPTFLNSIKSKSLPTNKAENKLSFLLRGRKSDEAIKIFFDRLKTEEFIEENTSLVNFKKVIKGDEFRDRIVWLKGQEHLKYIIHSLMVKKVLDYRGKSKWAAVCNSFVKSDFAEFNPKLLGKSHNPSYTNHLDSLCEILYKTDVNK